MLPYSLDLLSHCLQAMKAPPEPFHPNGEWTHVFSIWNPARAKAAKSERLGSLRIHRRLTPKGDIRLGATQITNMTGKNGSGRTKSGVTCKADALATPIQWKTDFEVLDPQGKTVPLTSITTSGTAAQLKVSGPLTSDWSLLDAVQRLPFDSKPLEFTMLEELELVRPGQRLSTGATADVEIGGRVMKLHSFEQLGHGVLPITYWLDENHRLIIVVQARRALVFESASGGDE